jgi:hypothetical protein
MPAVMPAPFILAAAGHHPFRRMHRFPGRLLRAMCQDFAKGMGESSHGGGE